MVGWHHQINGHKFEQASGDGEGQGSLCCSPWDRKESDTTQQLNDKCVCVCVCVCITESLCCTAEINTTCKSTILQLKIKF